MMEDIAAPRVYRRTANSSHVILAEGTHLLVQSHPKEVAMELDKFMSNHARQEQVVNKDKVQARL